MSRPNHHIDNSNKSPSESGPDQRSTSESSLNITKEEELPANQSDRNNEFCAEIDLNENSKPFSLGQA
jgi:hypothetical protein